MRDSKGRFMKGHPSGRKGIKRPEIQNWLKDVQFQKGQEPWNKGLHPEYVQGENHHKWKGDNVGYGALHDWVVQRLGKASFCSNDKNHEAPVYHWANISGEYKRDLNDWHSLCPSCNKTDGVSRLIVFDENKHRRGVVI